jgi:hypothetical protein
MLVELANVTAKTSPTEIPDWGEDTLSLAFTRTISGQQPYARSLEV